MQPRVKSYLHQNKRQRQAPKGFRESVAASFKTNRKVNKAYGSAGGKKGLNSRLAPNKKTLGKAAKDGCCKL